MLLTALLCVVSNNPPPPPLDPDPNGCTCTGTWTWTGIWTGIRTGSWAFTGICTWAWVGVELSEWVMGLISGTETGTISGTGTEEGAGEVAVGCAFVGLYVRGGDGCLGGVTVCERCVGSIVYLGASSKLTSLTAYVSSDSSELSLFSS